VRNSGLCKLLNSFTKTEFLRHTILFISSKTAKHNTKMNILFIIFSRIGLTQGCFELFFQSKAKEIKRTEMTSFEMKISLKKLHSQKRS